MSSSNDTSWCISYIVASQLLSLLCFFRPPQLKVFFRHRRVVVDNQFVLFFLLCISI